MHIIFSASTSSRSTSLCSSNIGSSPSISSSLIYFANTALEAKLRKPRSLFNFTWPWQWLVPLTTAYSERYQCYSATRMLQNKCLTNALFLSVKNRSVYMILQKITFKIKVTSVHVTKWCMELRQMKFCTRRHKKMVGAPCCCSVTFNKLFQYETILLIFFA